MLLETTGIWQRLPRQGIAMSKGDKPRGVTGVRNEEPPDIEAAERFELTRLKYGFWLLMTSIIVVSLIFTAAAIVLGDRLDSPAAVISLLYQR
jgi:hypothetical protein